MTNALGALTWTDLVDRTLTLLIPLGSLEQHGPHLPLDTDTRIAVAIAEGAAARLDDVVIGPTITVGASGEHAGFPGTLSIGTDALCTMLVELGRSADGFARLVFVNGHGGNRDAITEAVDRLVGEGRPVSVWSPTIPGADAHAGRTETSLLLAIAPEQVRLERAEPGALDPLERLLPALRSGGVYAVAPNGVLGDPSGASAAEGAAMLEGLVSALVAQLRSEP